MNGTIVFSVDAELAWGFHDLGPLSESQQRRLDGARAGWQELLELFEAHDVPATWAVVGHLLTADSSYIEHYPAPGEWFDRPTRGIETRPERWVARELVETIEASTVGHELASHGFSHQVFTEIDEEQARAECEFAGEVGAEAGYEFSSFVFPRNRIAHRSVLAAHGFDCYRGRRPTAGPEIPGLHGAQTLLGTLTETGAPPAVTPTFDEYGLVNVPASIFVGGFRNPLWNGISAVNGDPAVTLCKRGIDRACTTGEVFHMWLHPHDLTDARYLTRVRRILEYVSNKVRREQARVRTMGQVASRVRNDPDEQPSGLKQSESAVDRR